MDAVVHLENIQGEQHPLSLKNKDCKKMAVIYIDEGNVYTREKLKNTRRIYHGW